jgi:hypothetical protein
MSSQRNKPAVSMAEIRREMWWLRCISTPAAL